MLLMVGCKTSKAPIGFEQFVVKNGVLTIDAPINLQNKEHRLPPRTKLRILSGGSINSGSLVCHGCIIEAGPELVLNKVQLIGNWHTDRAYIEWVLGNNLADPNKNFESLCQLLALDFTVSLRNVIPIAKDDSHLKLSEQVRNIRLVQDKKGVEAGLILETKQKNLFSSYFSNPKGVNLYLSNIKIATRDYENLQYANNTSDYFFASAYYNAQFSPNAQPSIDTVVVDNCSILGAVSILGYGAHSANQSINSFAQTNLIKSMIVKGSKFDRCHDAFSFANMGFGHILIENNQIRNFAGAFLGIPESGIDHSYYETLRRNKGTVIFRSNHFENSEVVKVQSERTLTPCVIKGGYGSMVFEDNTLRNLLSYSTDADVNTFYFTCEAPGQCVAKRNTIENVVCRGSKSNPATLIKQRSAHRFVFEENSVSISEEALARIGVLKSSSAALSEINCSDFLCSFMQIGGQKDLTKELVIRNNYFSMPMMNLSTEIMDAAEFIFENNDVQIGYLCSPGLQAISTTADGVFFLGRQRLDRSPKQLAKDLRWVNNRIRVNDHNLKNWQFLAFPDGVQNGTIGNPDTNYNYRAVVMKDSFFVNGLNIGFALPDALSHDYQPILKGKSSSSYLIDAANANHLRPNSKKLKTVLKHGQSGEKDGSAPFALIPRSEQKAIFGSVPSGSITLLHYGYLTSLYNLEKEKDLICAFRVRAKHPTSGSMEKEFYVVIDQTYRLIKFPNQSDQLVGSDPKQGALPQPIKSVTQSWANQSDKINLELVQINAKTQESEVQLTGLQSLQEIEVTLRVFAAGETIKDRNAAEQKLKKFQAENPIEK
jgi:hypothetical protein